MIAFLFALDTYERQQQANSEDVYNMTVSQVRKEQCWEQFINTDSWVSVLSNLANTMVWADVCQRSQVRNNTSTKIVYKNLSPAWNMNTISFD